MEDFYKINYIYQKFSRHLDSIERLLKQDISKKIEPTKMDLGEAVSYVVDLKIAELREIEAGNDEKLTLIQDKLIDLRKYDMFNAIENKIEITREADNCVCRIDSPIFRDAFDRYDERATNEDYDFEQYHNSLVVSLVIGLEILIAEIFKDFINELDITNQVIKDKKLSFADLKSFNSVNDAKTYLEDQYIENLLRGSFDSWLEELTVKAKIELSRISELKEDILKITETLQRRHLIIHNDGIVNDLYIKKVNESLIKSVIKGEKLEMDKKYIQSRINIFRKFGVILIYLYAEKRFKSNFDKFFDVFNNSLLDLIYKGCEGARYVYRKFAENENISQAEKVISKVNYFLTFKYDTENTEDITNDIKKFDVSALSLEYKMAKSILLEEDNACNLTVDFLETISDDYFIDIIEWPLIKILNKDAPTKRYMSNRLKEIFEKEIQHSES